MDSSTEDKIQKARSERSTLQGVVRGLTTRIKNIVKTASIDKLKACEDLIKSLLDHQVLYDAAADTVRSLCEQHGLDNTENDAKSKQLTLETSSAYQDATNWVVIIKKKVFEAAVVSSLPSSPTGRVSPPVGSNPAGSEHAELILLREKVRRLAEKEEDLESARDEISNLRSALCSQEDDADARYTRYEETIRGVKEELSREQCVVNDLKRTLDDEKYEQDQLRTQLDRSRSSVGMGSPRAESTRMSIDSSDMRSFSQAISESNATVFQKVMEQTTEHHKSLFQTLQTPKIELQTFSGELTEYHAFLSRFDDIVDSTTMSDGAKLNTLLQSCSKDVRKHLDCCNYKEAKDGYVLAKEILKTKYGNPFMVSQAWVEKMMDYPVLKKADDILRFSSELKSCYQSLSALGYLSDLENTANTKLLVSKVPVFIQNRYRKMNRENLKKGVKTPLKALIELIEDAAEELADPVFGPESIKKLVAGTEKVPDKKPFRARGAANTASSDGGSKSTKGVDSKRPIRRIKCGFCKGEHYPRLCPDFTSLGPKDKLKLVQQKRLCYLCLNPFHDVASCLMKWTCQKEGCSSKHNTALHDAFDKKTNSKQTKDEDSDEDEESEAGGAVMHSATQDSYSLPIVPVYIQGKGYKMETNCLIDTGATMTFITRSLFCKLLLKPYARETFDLSTMGNKVSLTCDMVNFDISAVDKLNWIAAYGVAVVDELPIASTYVERLTDLDRWPYLQELNMSVPYTDKVEMLLGQSNARLFKSERSVDPPASGMPYACRLPIGWVVMGHYIKQPKVDDKPKPRGENDPIYQYDSAYPCVGDVKLEQQVDRFWQIEEVPDVVTVNPIDVKIMNMWDEKSVLRDGHLEVPIPVKRDPPNLPSNYYAVKKRFDSLTRRLLRDPELKVQYVKSMKDMFSKGYAEICTSEPREGYLYYHPQQAVISERRPGKCRIVGDIGITSDGFCLNREVHQGPNFTASIVEVVTRFRMYRVAITGDIKEMFSQVTVPEEQRDLLRFFWFKDDEVGGEMIECRMRTHPFGGIWCPAAAMYVYRWVVAHIQDKKCEEVIETLLKCFYVDDLLKSVVDNVVGERVIRDARNVLHTVGYDLIKIGSSDRTILENLPLEWQAKEFQEMELTAAGDTVTHTLGSVWKPIRDTLSFRAIKLDKPFTRRGVLSTTSSLYDPLGLIAPFVLRAKIILQKLCKLRLVWDEPVPAVYNPEWKAWLEDVPLLRDFEVPRWLGVTKDESDVFRLHVFTDASQDGYGAAVYLVVGDATGNIRSSVLVMAKSKVTPMNTISIPRLELSAAVLGVKLERTVRDVLKIKLEETKFWSDSMIVLWYVRGQAWKFKTFVANRITYLQEHTRSEQWHYVPTELNPADAVSRGLSAKDMIDNVFWKNGPDFLLDEEKIPKQPELHVPENDSDVKKQHIHVCTFSSSFDVTGAGIETRILGHYSRWNKMVRAVCVLKRFVKFLRTKKADRHHLRASEIKESTTVLFRWIQEVHLTKTQRKSKVFCKLFPFGNDGLWRVGGRLMMSSLTYEHKHPPILPDCEATRVYVRHVHQRSGHPGVDRTYYDVRASVWVLGGKTSIKSAIGSCVFCKRMRGKMSTQVMAPLPAERVTAGTVPFEKVGIDYCGPFYVKVGRSRCKRYICTITCLLTRATHFEVAFYLTTTSFLHALQRFIARRGRPKLVVSDNGSNFIGAKRELKAALKEFNMDYIGKRLADDGIEWKFNIPLASHHGGVWERLNRSFRSTFQAIAGHQVLTDETLPTFTAAVEQVLNSRPLTRVSEDIEDLEVITPDHLLNLKRSEPIPGAFKKGDILRGHWKKLQYLADIFWKRWSRTYLQSLQVRQKWLEPGKDLTVGEIVLVLDESTSRLDWPLARVIDVFVGRDGHVRSALVKTQAGEYKRPLTKLLRLECDL